MPLVRAGLIKAMAHITGGGLVDNIPRVLPDGTDAIVDATGWDLPPVFRWLKTAGRINDPEMARAFNCGIGLVAVVSAEKADIVEHKLKAAGEQVLRIGMIEAQEATAAEPMVSMRNRSEEHTSEHQSLMRI